VDVVKELSGAPRPASPAGSAVTEPNGFGNACGACHDDDVIRQQRLTRAQWDREIGKMTGWGAQVKDEDRSGLLDYLLRNYGPRPRGR